MPSKEFKMMITSFLQNRQTSVSTNDVSKHSNRTIDFYSISKIKMNGNSIVSQTTPLSEDQMIEIKQGGSTLTIYDDINREEYVQVSAMNFTTHQGKGLLYWTAKNRLGEVYTIVKLMSPDGFVQIKLIHPNQQIQIVHNVCEMPSKSLK